MAEPITRKEMYLAAIAGEWNGTLPSPITREEQYLYDIAVNGGSLIQADWQQTDVTAKDYIKNKPVLGTAAEKDSTNAVTAESTDLVESGAVKAAINEAISGLYFPAGDITCAELIPELLINDNLGKVFNATDSGVSTTYFVGGAGKTINAGDNIAIVNTGTVENPVYMFDNFTGLIDLSTYQKKLLTSPITVDGTETTTVESALNAINNVAEENSDNISDIQSIIPSDASALNPLATVHDVTEVNISSSSSSSPVTDSASGMVQGLTIYGASEVTEDGIKSVGDDGLTVTTANSDNTLTTSANFTTALPLRGVSDTVRDKLTCTAESKQVETVCGKVRLADLAWSADSYHSGGYSADLSESKTGIISLLCEAYPYDSSISFRWVNFESYSNKTLYRNEEVSKIYVKDTDYTTLSDFVASLGDAELVYELATPVTTPLTTAEISAFRSLRTYDSTTNITISDEPEFALDYLKNSENGRTIAKIQADLQAQIDEVKNEKSHFCYSYKIDMSDSNPATCVKPYFDTRYGCDNFNFTSAHMDYANDRFDYGSWEGFIRRIARPCMLKYDGTVDYYLDPDDYSKKITGEASDVADVNYQGNAMVELEKLYFKRYTYNGIQYCFIADRKLDKSFKAYAHHDKYGKELDYIYRACYDGMYDGTRLRSISGIDYHNADALTVNKIMSNTTRQKEMDFAKANNTETEKGEGWFILHKAEWDYINDILVLIGMSTNTQATFGNGNILSYVSTTNTGIIATGTMDKKGLFYGKNDNVSGVKVLGFENPWGNIWKSCAGWNLVNGEQKVKMTYNTEDYSSDAGYNTDASGYPTITSSTPSGTSGSYISDWITGESGLIPLVASGSASTFHADGLWFDNSINAFALVGGTSNNSARCGAFCMRLDDPAAYVRWDNGAALSYKPLAATATVG